MKEHISAARHVEVCAERELPDERPDAVELCLVPQLLHVDPLETQRSVPQIVQDEAEQLGVAVDENGPRLVALGRDPAGQHGSKERVLGGKRRTVAFFILLFKNLNKSDLYGSQCLSGRGEPLAAHIEMYDLPRHGSSRAARGVTASGRRAAAHCGLV